MQQVTENWQGHLGETKTRNCETEQLGFLAVAMSNELNGAGYRELVGLSWRLGF